MTNPTSKRMTDRELLRSCMEAMHIAHRVQGSRTDWSMMIEDIRRHLESPAHETTGWRPIETAPRDGTWVLIACGEVYKAQWDAEHELWHFDVDGCAVDPNAWMPLPALPGLPLEPAPCPECAAVRKLGLLACQKHLPVNGKGDV